MALVVKRNPVRNAVTLVILAVMVVGGLVYFFRDRLFPAAPTSTGTGAVPEVRDLPTYPTSGGEVLNTNAALELTPHGVTNINGNPGRPNPFEPAAGS
jgi:hypothetical protein